MANSSIGAGKSSLTYNSVNITQYVSQADLDAAINQIDVTNLASTGGESLPDLPEWRISAQGFWDATVDATLAPDVITPGTKRTAIMTFTDAAATTITYTWTTKATLGNFKWSSSPRAAKTFSCEIVLSGAPVRS